jgi:hypothetical protein
MLHPGRYCVDQSRWHNEWLLSVAQAFAMLTFSVLLRWIVS